MVFIQYWYIFAFILAIVLFVLYLTRNQPTVAQVKKKITLAQMKRLNDYEFESIVAEYFKRNGYKVHHMKKGKDAGKDLILWDDTGDKYYVEVKNWNTSNVGRPVVQKLQGAMTVDGIQFGFVVTSADFTRDAIEWSKNCNVTLINGKEFEKLYNTW